MAGTRNTAGGTQNGAAAACEVHHGAAVGPRGPGNPTPGHRKQCPHESLHESVGGRTVHNGPNVHRPMNRQANVATPGNITGSWKGTEPGAGSGVGPWTHRKHRAEGQASHRGPLVTPSTPRVQTQQIQGQTADRRLWRAGRLNAPGVSFLGDKNVLEQAVRSRAAP